MSFDTTGFLGEQIQEFSLSNYQNHKILFEVGYELNKFAYNLMHSINLDADDSQHLICCSLFSKIHSGYQAILILYKMGLETEAKVILRTILEATFVLKAISEDKNEVKNFIDTDKKQQENLLKIILEKDEANLYKDIKGSLSKEKLDELKKEIKEEGIKDIKIYEWANKAQLDIMYAYAYKMLNFEVHTDVRTLSKYLEIDKENNLVVGINSLPSDREINSSLLTAYSIMLIVLGCLNHMFNLELDEELRVQEDKVMTLRT